MPDMLAAYNRPRDRVRCAETFSIETLGGGLRGQSIVVVGWKQYRPDELTGMCFRFMTRKNQRGRPV